MHNISIKEYLLTSGEYYTTPHGDSMWPLLHNKKDAIRVVSVTGRLKKHDVALYIRPNGQYVLHRVMKVCPDSYVMCGDSQFTLEPGVKDEQVIGRLDGFYRGEKYHTVRDLSYKIYVAVWCLSPRIRKPLMKIVGYLENKKLKKQKGKKDEKM